MFRKLILASALVGLLGALTPVACHAHFVWMRIDNQEDQEDRATAHLFFSEGGNLDGDRLPEKIQQATATLHVAGQGAKPFPLSESQDGDFISLNAPVDARQTFAVTTDCQYGLYHGSLLHYYAKAIHLADINQLNTVAKVADWKLDVVPAIRGDKLILGVTWNGRPLPDNPVSVIDPSGEELELTTDAQGASEVAQLQPGLYVVRVNWDDDDDSGTIADEEYSGASYYTTLTIRIPQQREGAAATHSNHSGYALLPVGIASFGAAVNGDWIYVYGGHMGKAHAHSHANVSPHFRRMNLVDEGPWESLPMQTPVQGLAMVAHGDYVYRIGGLQALNAPDEDERLRSVSDFARFDVKRLEWEALPELPQPRSSHDAVVVGDRLYVLGGWTRSEDGGEEWLDQGLVMDLSADNLKWETFEVPFRRRALAVATRDGLVYAIGGLDVMGEIDRTVDVFDPATGKWDAAAEMPGEGMDGFGISAWQLNGRLFVSGMSGTVLEFDADSGSWKTAGQLHQGRFFHRLLPTHDGDLMAIAGASVQGHLTDTELVDVR